MNTLDIRAPEFWSGAALDGELRRVFDICNGCRRCLPLCPSFKDLMASLDRDEVDGDAERLPAADMRRVVDLCYQCKLCYNHCPYTPPHRWMIDFPRVMLRARAVAVLRHNRVDVSLPAQRCCGMPYLDGGAVEEARRLIDDNVRDLGEAVRDGREIVVPGPTCSYMMKQEWPWLATDRAAAGLVAERTRDLFEYLARLHGEGRLETRFPNRPGRIAYQIPCHLRAQNMGTKSADVLRLTGAEVTVIERCSAVDGTWGFKREYYELSMKLAEPLFREVGAARPDRTATDCPLANLQIVQGTGRRVQHPIQILAEAYGLPAE